GVVRRAGAHYRARRAVVRRPGDAGGEPGAHYGGPLGTDELGDAPAVDPLGNLLLLLSLPGCDAAVRGSAATHCPQGRASLGDDLWHRPGAARRPPPARLRGGGR